MYTSKGNPSIMGVTKGKGGYNFAVISEASEVTLWLYPPKTGKKETVTINLDATFKMGEVFSVFVEEENLCGWSYDYSCEEKHFTDPRGKTISGHAVFGTWEEGNPVSLVELTPFDWKNDRNPCIPYDDTIIYKIHPRGFTRHKSSGVSQKGTFAGLTEKIPYLKDLGITAVELMPAYDFDETEQYKAEQLPPYMKQFPVNYWGYTNGYYFTPKPAYCACAKKREDYTVEFKEMVRTFHENGIEVIMEMLFLEVTPDFVLDCVRYWVLEYHIDGIHVWGNKAAVELLAVDPMLAGTKIFTPYWENSGNAPKFKNLSNYNEGFLVAARRFLKGDDDQIGSFLRAVAENPVSGANVNYIAGHNGFTLMDLVSYERRHNEANGENNQDGTAYNYSWNCGAEGPTRKKKIQSLRLTQIKNALMMVFLSQGTPLLMSGDEMGNSQKGNNNPYCQDNETGWVNWGPTVMGTEICSFLKALIEYRKAHKILHMKERLKQSDYLSCGFPDVSYHGDNAWIYNMDTYKRYAGILYCGRYAPGNTGNELIYAGYNMHWEAHELALPKGGQNGEWKIVLSSCPREAVTFGEDMRKVIIPPRSIVVLEGTLIRPEQPNEAAKRTKSIRQREQQE